MEDFPKTLMEFESRFSTEEACVDYLVQLRWLDGFVCPSCAGRKAWRTERMLFHCAGCGRQVSVTAGTIFQGTRKSLAMWFRAMWWVTSQKNGASEQRCWPIYEETGKTANVLDKLPKRLQAAAKEKLHQIWMADTCQHAGQAFDLFLDTYEAKCPKACECLRKDRDALLAFYDFPAEH